MCLPILIAFFTTAPGRKYYHDSHFLEEETEAQSAWLTCSLSRGLGSRRGSRNWKPPSWCFSHWLWAPHSLLSSAVRGDTCDTSQQVLWGLCDPQQQGEGRGWVIHLWGPGYKDTGLCGFSTGSLEPSLKKLRAFAGTWPGQPPSPESREGSGDRGELCERGSVKAQQWPRENQRQKELGSRVSQLWGPPRPSPVTRGYQQQLQAAFSCRAAWLKVSLDLQPFLQRGRFFFTDSVLSTAKVCSAGGSHQSSLQLGLLW